MLKKEIKIVKKLRRVERLNKKISYYEMLSDVQSESEESLKIKKEIEDAYNNRIVEIHEEIDKIYKELGDYNKELDVLATVMDRDQIFNDEAEEAKEWL